ncbi:hypothetical protein [Halorubrum salipaludis]|uniref:hypothetical protein n=1 Tax=Halorubrum salipaludis TaxID=2032630 RepID=UPI001181A694|nr:hypothetical protein [Halorubrum salipaludis]
MNLVDRFSARVTEAIGGMVLTLVATVGGIIIRSAREVAPATEPATSLSLNLMAGLITSLPGIVTLLGIAGATVIAGPFGFIGALFEVAGANQILYYQSEAGLWMIFFGAALVTIGAPIRWLRVLEWFLDSGGRY